MAPSREATVFGAAYAMLLVAYVVPLFVAPVLPGLDLPFHSALADMVAKAGDPESPYAPFYALRLWPTPPALPWVLVALAGKIAGAYAMHVVVTAYVAVLPLAVAAYARALGGAVLPCLLAFPLAFNVGLHYGFLGFVLSLPALFGTLALATRMAGSDSIRARSWIGLALAGCGLYGLHLETYALGVAVVGATALAARGAARVRVACAAAMIPSLVAAVLWSAGTPYATGPAHRGPRELVAALIAERRAELAMQSLFGDVTRKMAGIPVHLLRGFRDGVDLRASHAIVGLLAASIVLGLVRRDRQARLDWRAFALRASLPGTALLAYLFLPHHLDAFEAMSISPRLAPLFVLALVSVATTPLVRLRPEPRTLLAGVGAIGLGGYAIVLTARYAAYADETRDLVDVVRAVPLGEQVVGLLDDGESRVMNVESILRAIPSAYVALRADRRSMVALRYCGMRHIPCSKTARASTLPETNPWLPRVFDARAPGNVFSVAITDRPLLEGKLAGRPAHVIAQRGRFAAVRFD